MPRNGSGVYSADWVNASPNTTVESSKQNALVADLVTDANAARPITAGGTAGITAVEGADNLSTKGTSIASAATTDIGAATGRFVHITGTTTITALGTKTAGVERELVFDGALILTHNGTSLILPGAANITTAAGDTAIFVSEGSGNWRCVVFQKAGGTVWEDLGEVAVSGASVLTKGSLGPYKALRITGLLRPDTANQQIILQTSTDAGSSFATTSGDYAVQYIRAQGATVEAAGNSTQTGCFITGTSVGSGANEGVAFEVIIHEFNVAAWMRMEGKVTARIGAGTIYHETNSSLRLSTTARNALRIIAVSGNITGYARFEGMRG